LQNQGWEEYNAIVDSFWHQCMQKGGNLPIVKNNVKLIADWITQLFIWRAGDGEQFFTNNSFNTDNANATANNNMEEDGDKEHIS